MTIWDIAVRVYMHSAGQKVSKSDTIVNIIISGDEPSRPGTAHNTACTPHKHTYIIYYTITGDVYLTILMRTTTAPTRMYARAHYTHSHTHTHTRTHTRYMRACDNI